MSRHIMAAFMLALAVLLAVPATAQQPVEVTFWYSHSNPVDVAAIEEIISGFNASHPNIVVKGVQVPGSETDATRLMTAVRGGIGPDVYLLDRFTVAQRAQAGLLTDLTGFIQASGTTVEEFAQQYLDWAWAEVLYNGKVYALPWDADVRALYYRKDLLRAAGFDPAEFDPKNGPVTPERLKEVAFALNEKDQTGAYTRIGFIPSFEQGWHYTWGFAFGGKFYDLATREVTPTDPGVLAGFRFLYDWNKDLGFQAAQTFVNTYWAWPDAGGLSPAMNPFFTGRTAFWVSGDWLISQIAQYAPNIEYGITYLPSPDGTPRSWSGGWSVVIPAGAKHPEEAFEFMKYFAGEPGQRVYLTRTRHLPTVVSLLHNDELYTEEHQFFKDLLPYSTARPVLPVGALYWDELTKAQEKVLLGAATPEEALRAVYDRVQPQLERAMR